MMTGRALKKLWISALSCEEVDVEGAGQGEAGRAIAGLFERAQQVGRIFEIFTSWIIYFYNFDIFQLLIF